MWERKLARSEDADRPAIVQSADATTFARQGTRPPFAVVQEAQWSLGSLHSPTIQRGVGVAIGAGIPPVSPDPRPRFAVGIALAADRLVPLAEAERFAVAQAHLVVIARLLREDAWQGMLVIVRQDSGAIVERTIVSASVDAEEPAG
jgi:hypothetical protein